MATLVQVCNMALGRLGIHQSISSLDENSQLAQTCNQYLDQARRALLADFDWPFAKVLVPLALTGNQAPPPWGVEYARPDCIRVRSVEVLNTTLDPSVALPGYETALDFGVSYPGGIGGPSYQGGQQPYNPGNPSPTVIPFTTGAVQVQVG